MKKTIALILSAVILLCCFSACNSGDDQNDNAANDSQQPTEEVTEAPFVPAKANQIDKSEVTSIRDVSVADEQTNYVLITVANYGKMLVRLYPNVAPTAVKAFKENVSNGFYDSKNFDLVIKHSFIQCGNTDGEAPQPIYGEFKSNGFENNLSHTRGVLSLPRADDTHSDSSRFFICTKPSPALNPQHAAFGFVVYGADIIDKIASVKIDANQKPLSSIVIESVKFVTLPQ